MNKRAMISQPMAGKTDEEIAETRDKAHDMFGFELSCGHEVQGYEKPKYCSKCGAVVVDED